MAQAIQCDRCKQFQEKQEDGTWKAIHLYGPEDIGRQDRFSPGARTLDLCDSCMDELVKWLRAYELQS